MAVEKKVHVNEPLLFANGADKLALVKDIRVTPSE
ncbi:MAG: hypothetical protein ACJAW1_002169 [Glaciecola sp.]|jgi:hypothetical protein